MTLTTSERSQLIDHLLDEYRHQARLNQVLDFACEVKKSGFKGIPMVQQKDDQLLRDVREEYRFNEMDEVVELMEYVFDEASPERVLEIASHLFNLQ